MKHLILVRHAKAKKAEGTSIKDIDRPLNVIGYEQAYQMTADVAPHVKGNVLFVSSSSVRTLSTAFIFADKMDYSRSAIRLENSLYLSDADSYLDVISSVEDSVDTLLIFGHNPTISELITDFGGQAYGDVPPGSVAIFKTDLEEWPSIIHSKLTLKALFLPKN